jgi:hypothetical protein
MVGLLLTRGMLVGILAGVLCFGFLKVFGEPQVDRAIAFEQQMDEAKEHKADADHAASTPNHDMPNHDMPNHDMPNHDMPGHTMPAAYEPELVSRPVQAGLGLFTGVAVYSTAFGGLFALAFALAYGRMAKLSPRATSALLAAMGFVAVYAVPNLKYPANPPSIGAPDTIGMRTALYFAVIAVSLAAMIAAGMLRNRLVRRLGAWNATLVAGGFYIVVVFIVGLVLPIVNEVPEQFSAVVLWQFRIASLGAQLIMWTTIGLAFGALAERVLSRRSGAAATF